MRICNKCKQERPLSEYYRYSYQDFLICKPCCRANNNRRDRWKNYSPEQKRHQRRARRNKARDFVLDFLQKNPCTDCGESDPIVLEFDHIKSKNFSISAGMRNGKSTKALMREIKNCEVVCANCHRRRTAARAGNWAKDKLLG